MGALSDEVVPCELCRGRGWRFVSSRLVVAVRAVDGGEERLPRRACAGCAGTGQAAGSDATVTVPSVAGGLEQRVGT